MIWLNGHIQSLAAPALSLQDRGFLLGEGVFETIALRNDKICLWDSHWHRLSTALNFFDIPCTYSPEQIVHGIQELTQVLDLNSAVIRVSVSTGAGGRGLVPKEYGTPNWAISLTAYSPEDRPISLGQVSIIRPAGNPVVKFKTLSYIDNIMARKLAQADEALMLNQFGRVSCAAAGNIFLHIGGELLTPPCSEGALDGIIRGEILRRGKIEGLVCRERALTRQHLREAQNIVITNSLIGAQLVDQLYLSGEAPIKKGSPSGPAILNSIQQIAF